MRLGLGRRLGLVVGLFGALTVVLCGLAFNRIANDALTAQAEAFLESVADEKAAYLEAWFHHRLSHVESVAAAPWLRALVSLPDKADSTRAINANLTFLSREHPSEASILLLDARTGEVVAASDEADIGKFKENRPFFLEGLERPALIAPYYSITHERPVIHAAAPVQDNDGQTRMVLATLLSLDDIETMLGYGLEPLRTLDSYLVNRNSLFVTRPRFLDGSVFQSRTRAVDIERCMKSRHGARKATSYRGRPVLSQYRWLKEIDVCLVLEVERSEVLRSARVILGPEYGVFARWAGIVLVGAVGAAAIGMVLARGIVRPISSLTRATSALARGSREVELPAHRSDEFGDLARSFRRMTDSLHDHETRLRGVNERLDLILNSAGEGIYGFDLEGRITFINRAAATMLGWDGAEMLGRTAHDLFHHGLANGSSHPATACPLMMGPQDGHPRHMSDDVFRRHDGSTFPVEYTRTPIERDGIITGAVVVFRDVSRQRKVESMAARFGRIVEASANEIYIFDAETLRFVRVNQGARRNLGYTMEELERLTPLDLKPRFTSEQFAALVQPLRDGTKDLIVFETIHRRKDGTNYDVEAALQLMRGENPPVFFAIIQDITERKQADLALTAKTAELERSNEELKQFSHAISHDLQEPLKVVASFLSLLRDRYQGRLDAQADEFIEFAIGGTERMSGMIQDLLEYCRVQSRAAPPTPVPMDEVLSVALENLRSSIEEAGAMVIVPDRLPVLPGDRSQLTRVFQNLIGNAIKYRAPSRPMAVDVSVERRDDLWVFAVRDNGIGIEPRHFEYIFGVFRRLHGEGQYGGTGIGLAVVKRIVERHGGRVWVESTPGVGSTFFVALPGTNGEPSS